MFCVFFFFQAEDGIRDVAVTGVQTCALPIYAYFQYVINEDVENSNYGNPELEIAKTYVQMNDNAKAVEYFKKALPKMRNRSEERRVGKECRSRCSPDH